MDCWAWFMNIEHRLKGNAPDMLKGKPQGRPCPKGDSDSQESTSSPESAESPTPQLPNSPTPQLPCSLHRPALHLSWHNPAKDLLDRTVRAIVLQIELKVAYSTSSANSTPKALSPPRRTPFEFTNTQSISLFS